MLYVDLPTNTEIAALASDHGDIRVSIFLPTTPLTQDAQADRIVLKNLAKEAARQLHEAGADKRRSDELAEHLDDLIDDDEFWRFQARSLVILATPERVRTFRVANALQPLVEVSDRFHLKPLLRAVTFPHAAYVLALAENSVRLVEVSGEMPAVTAKVAGMPQDAASSVGKSSINDRSPSGRIHGSEGKKVRLRQYARQVDQALRGLLAGSDVPLILATNGALGEIFRSVNSYPRLAAGGIDGNPETLSDAELAERARSVLDGLHRQSIAAWADLFAAREAHGRATTDIAQAARAATFGAVESLLIDIDESVPGTIDEGTGEITLAPQAGAKSYGVVDEIARRVILSQGNVLGVRKDDIPHGKSLAAILRYPV
ncbi:MAG: hypothetical protein WAS21_01185 [Geminicoccaceae bacterium]